MKVVIVVLVVVLLLFAVAVGVAARNDDRSPGDPTSSGLSFFEDRFPPRRLTGQDAVKGGARCVQGDTLELAGNGTCVFIVPDEVQQVRLRRVAGSGPVTVELVPPGDGLQQKIDTAKNGPKDDDPDEYRLGVVDDGSRITATCRGFQPCRLELEP